MKTNTVAILVTVGIIFILVAVATGFGLFISGIIAGSQVSGMSASACGSINVHLVVTTQPSVAADLAMIVIVPGRSTMNHRIDASKIMTTLSSQLLYWDR